MTMTFREICRKHLVDNGLFEDQAEAALATLDEEAAKEPECTRTLNRDASDYPPSVAEIYLVKARHAAAEWIRANMPKHWALGMFEGPA
jgi:hypothetical protein